MAEFPGIVHVALTVTDLDRSVEWYSALFGAPPDGRTERQDVRTARWDLVTTSVVLRQPTDPSSHEPFDELAPGMDHLAFSCPDRAELERWVARLEKLGVGHGEILDEVYGSGLAFRDPDNIALEIFAPPA